MKLHFFSFIVICNVVAQISAINSLNNLFIGREWEFMEDQFIIKPNLAANNFNQQCKKWAPSIGSGLIAGYATDRLVLGYVPEKTKGFELQSFLRFMGDPIIGFGTMYAIYKLIKFRIQNAADYQTLINFIRAWPENKSVTPEQFQTTFDGLYNQYIRNGSDTQLNQQASEITRLIKNAIYNHFPTKYEHQLKDENAPFYQHTFFHTIVTLDIGDLIRTLANIVNAFFSK